MDLLIYGASSQAKESYDIVVRNYPEKYDNIYFIDDFVEEGSHFYNSSTIHYESIRKMYESAPGEVEGIVSVGEPLNREKLTIKLEEAGIKLATIIDKTSIVSPSAIIGAGSIICEYSVVHANANIGKGVLVQSFCAIGHDIQIGDYSVVSAGFLPGGGCVIGKCVFAGMNVTIKEKTNIGDNVIMGMGAAVFSDLPPFSTAVGNPARITRGNDDHKVYR